MHIRTGLALAAAALLSLSAASAAPDECTWTRQPDGSERGACVDHLGRTYCLTCQGEGRVCARTEC